MNCSQKKVEVAILVIAESYNQLEAYDARMQFNRNLPELVKDTVYTMFINGFDCNDCDDELYVSYLVIKEYATELSKNGFVNFN